jgi:hypothetical protein
LIGKHVILLYHEHQPDQVEVLHKNLSYGLLTTVDLNINARVTRNKNSGTDLTPAHNARDYKSGKLWAPRKEHQ